LAFAAGGKIPVLTGGEHWGGEPGSWMAACNDKVAVTSAAAVAVLADINVVAEECEDTAAMLSVTGVC